MSDAATSAETENTATSAETENTATGQGTGPSRQYQDGIDEGVGIGKKQALAALQKKLGLSATDIRSAVEEIEGWKAPKQEQQQEVDIQNHPEFLTAKAQYEKDHAAVLKSLEVAKAQADEARLDKLRGIALAMGVGPGKQLAAFISLHGDRVQFGDDRELRVMDVTDKGVVHQSAQSVDEWLSELLEEEKFLLKPKVENTSGVVGKIDPVGPEANRKAYYKSFGVPPPKKKE